MPSFQFKSKPLLPLLILTGLMIYTTIIILTTSTVNGNQVTQYVFTPKHYAAIAAILMCFGIFFLARKWYKYVLVITLLLGVFRALNFNVDDHFFNVRIGVLLVTFQPLLLGIALFTLLINWSHVKKLIATNRPAEHEPLSRAEIQKFRLQYSNSSDEELRKVLDDARFKPEAREAVRAILEERNTK